MTDISRHCTCISC